MQINYKVFAGMPTKGNYSHHLFIDVETTPGGAALIVRGDDLYLFPHVKAPFRWNNQDCSAKDFVIAMGSIAEMKALHSAILAMYLKGDPTETEALEATPGALAVYAVLAWLFPVGAFGKSGRRVDSYSTRNLTRRHGKAKAGAEALATDAEIAAAIARAQG